MEILRRLIALVCVLAAVWTAVVTSPGVYQVKLVDFAREQQQTRERDADAQRLMRHLIGENTPVTLHPEALGSVEAFAAKELDGRLYLGRQPAWQTLVTDVRALTRGTASPALRAVHAGRNHGLRDYHYYALDDSLLRELGGVLGPRHAFTYVQVDMPQGPRYLAITYLSPVDALRSAAPALTSPFRQQSVWWLIAGLLWYALLPCPPRRDDTLRYNRARCVVVPDLLGFLLAGFFYALPLLVLSRDSNMYGILEAAGWLTVSIVVLLFTLFGVALLITGLWYAGFSLQVLPDGIRLTTWGWRTRRIAFTEVTEARDYVAQAPRWLLVVAWLAFLARPLQGAQSLMLLSQKHHGIELLGTDGRSTKIIVEYFPGWQRLLDALHAAGIPLSVALQDARVQTRDGTATSRYVPSWVTNVLVLLLAVGIGVGGWRWMQWQDTPPPIPQRTLSRAELDAEKLVLNEMQQTNTQLQAAFARWGHASKANKDAAYAEYEHLLDRSQQLGARFDQINAGQSELAPQEVP